MKSRQWLITLGLSVLILAALIGLMLTSTWAPESSQNSRPHRTPLVDEQPLKTARAVAKLASSLDERRFADQALRLADNEVDLAFEDGLRDAVNHPVTPTPQTQQLYTHVSEAEADVKANQDRVNQLKKQLETATGAHQDSLQEQLDVAQAQLGLDQDELDAAKEDLARSGADPVTRIRRQLKRHDDAEHEDDAKPASVVTPDVDSENSNLLAHFIRWRALRQSTSRLQQAYDETVQAVAVLSQAHDALQKQVNTDKASKRALSSPAAGQGSNPSTAPDGTAAAPSAIKSLQQLSDNHKNLSDLDKRIQDEQELETTYGNWIALVQSHQRSAMHGMIQSILWILIIVLAVYLSGRSIDHFLAGNGRERTRLHTLRVVIRSSVQAVGVLLALLVVFGTPSQMPTILGLAGAGLTVALKDFIVAFFGWFVLMGKNGLRVGDWVEINGVAGEVVEINLLRTVLLETGNWTDTGHPTGRKVAFVNNYAIEGHFFNFTTSGQWMWDELQITVPPNQDPYPVLDAIQKAVAKETESNARSAETEWQNATSHYKVRSVSATPVVNLRPTAAGVEVHVRYMVRAQERSAIRSRLNQVLVELLHHRGVDSKETLKAAK